MLPVVGRYRTEELIGEGTVARIYAARHAETGAVRALKVPKRRNDGVIGGRMVREAAVGERLDHPHVRRIFSLDEDPQGPFLVMELLRGAVLAEHLRGGPLPLAEVARLALGLSGALRHAHERGLIHRDVKAENVFLTEDGVLKLLDFGLAKVADDPGPALTQSGTVVGTPYAMSPEQAFGEGEVDHRTDVWSAGVVLFQALSGRRPVDGANTRQVFRVLLTGAVPRLALTMPDLPEEVSGVVDRMLAREVGSRLSDLREVEEIFARYAS